MGTLRRTMQFPIPASVAMAYFLREGYESAARLREVFDLGRWRGAEDTAPQHRPENRKARG